MSYGLFSRMGKGQVSTPAPQGGSNLGSATVVAQLWTLSRHANHLDILPGNTTAEAGSNRFHASLFGRKAGGKALSCIRLASAVANLFRGKNPSEEAISMTVQHLLDSRNFSDINTGTEDHGVQVQVTASWRIIAGREGKKSGFCMRKRALYWVEMPLERLGAATRYLQTTLDSLGIMPLRWFEALYSSTAINLHTCLHYPPTNSANLMK